MKTNEEKRTTTVARRNGKKGLAWDEGGSSPMGRGDARNGAGARLGCRCLAYRRGGCRSSVLQPSSHVQRSCDRTLTRMVPGDSRRVTAARQ